MSDDQVRSCGTENRIASSATQQSVARAHAIEKPSPTHHRRKRRNPEMITCNQIISDPSKNHI